MKRWVNLELMQATVEYERAIGHQDAEKDAQLLEEVKRKAGMWSEIR